MLSTLFSFKSIFHLLARSLAHPFTHFLPHLPPLLMRSFFVLFSYCTEWNVLNVEYTGKYVLIMNKTEIQNKGQGKKNRTMARLNKNAEKRDWNDVEKTTRCALYMHAYGTANFHCDLKTQYSISGIFKINSKEIRVRQTIYPRTRWTGEKKKWRK